MTSIEEYSKEPIYTIKILSERTGVKPVTLRAWEHRYSLLEPERLENNYRLYSERDIEIIRWITHRLGGGLSISRAVQEYFGMREKGVWPEALPTVPGPNLLEEPQHPPQVYANQLFRSLTSQNETEARKTMDSLQKMFDLKTIFLDIFHPCLYEIGEAWYRGEIRIATEHFASGFIHGILINFLQAFPVYSSAPSLLIGCAPEEFHEIAPLMLSVLLRREGYQVEFLGPNLPVEDLVAYAEDVTPDMIILSAGVDRTARPLYKMQSLLNELPAQPRLGFGGRYFNENEQARAELEGIFLGTDLDQAVQNVHTLLD